MNRPSGLTIAAASLGGLALTATAVVAVAATDAPSEENPSVSSQTQEPEPSTPDASETPSTSDDDQDAAADCIGSDDASVAGSVTQVDAIAIAERVLADMGAVPPLREVELDDEQGRTVWEVEFGADHEVYVDAATGEVVKVELDDDRGRDDDLDDDRGRDDDQDDD
jgi:hypothetical protein